MSNSIAPGSSADVNVRVTALTTNPNVPVTYKTVILKKNLVNGVNTLTQEMMSIINTKYVIKYDYVLGEDIIMPAGCILEFDGGSISASGNNDTITGQNTGIQAGLVKIFSTDVTIDGTWNVAEAYSEWFGAVSNEVIDCTLAIQKTLDIFSCCYFHEGIYKVTSHINVTGNIYGQYSKSIIKPYHDGDVFRFTIANKSIIGLKVKGGEWDGPYTQPRTGTAGAAFVVGYNGANAQNCRIQDCVIYVFYGIGILWEHGSKLIAENVTINKMTSDGIRCTATYNDNNEGTFLNTHIMNCSGIGYNLMDGETRKDANASRCHCFVNTKGFGNNPNYYIGTIGNYGWIMTELPKSPSHDELGSKSAGNSLMVYSTEAEFSNFIDNGFGNVLSGYSVWNLMVDRKRYVKELYINNQLEGYHKFFQTASKVFEDSFEGTDGNVTVNHAKGTASGRTDVFEGVKAKVNLLEFNMADSAWYNYFTPNSGAPDVGPKPLRIKNDAGTFEDPLVICPLHDNNGYRWGIGTKTSGRISLFVNGNEILKIREASSLLRAFGSTNVILSGLNGPTTSRPLDAIKNDDFKGSIYLDTTIGKPTWLYSFDTYYNPFWIEADGAKAGVKRSGTWAQRPTAPANIYEGFMYMLNDTDLHIPIYAHIEGDPATITWYKADGTQYTG